jgi:sulfur carrier protein
MTICVNNEKQDVNPDVSLQVVLSAMGMDSRKGIAVSLNQRIIPRGKWELEIIREQDEIVIIEASQGG